MHKLFVLWWAVILVGCNDNQVPTKQPSVQDTPPFAVGVNTVACKYDAGSCVVPEVNPVAEYCAKRYPNHVTHDSFLGTYNVPADLFVGCVAHRVVRVTKMTLIPVGRDVNARFEWVY